MELNDNEQRIIDVLMSDPTINNRELANRCHVAQRTLNGTFTGLYSKFGIVGNGRAKRTKLIDALRPEKD